MTEDAAVRVAEQAIRAHLAEPCFGSADYAKVVVDAARPIIEAEALRKAADVITADEFTADDPTSYDPDYWGGLAKAASYLRRTADRTEPGQ